MPKSLRVVVWGIGGIGGACLRQIFSMPELRLVGVLVYDKAKEGLDAAELVGLPPCGVFTTRDRMAILALKPDCVLYAARDYGDFRCDADHIELLTHGINIITSLPYHYMKQRADEQTVALENACESGKSSLFAAGVNPGVIFERLALTATGAVNELKSLTIDEFAHLGDLTKETLNAFGMGVPAAQSKDQESVRKIAEQYYGQSLYYLADVFGTPVTSLQYTGEWTEASRPVPLTHFVVAPGEVECISHRWEATPLGGPVLRYQVRWYLSDGCKPDGVPCEDYYVITLEGTPSIRLKVELRASVRDWLRFYAGDPTTPSSYASAVSMLQSISRVVMAAPGIVPTLPPPNGYWKTNSLRKKEAGSALALKYGVPAPERLG